MGVILIGSVVGGIKDIVIDFDVDLERVMGFFVLLRDVFVFVRMIICVFEFDEEILKRFRENGKRRVREDFMWEKVCRRYLRVY